MKTPATESTVAGAETRKLEERPVSTLSATAMQSAMPYRRWTVDAHLLVEVAHG